MKGEIIMEDKKIFNKQTFFFPEARVLNNDEISKLSPDKKATAEKVGQNGLWLEVECPDASCMDDSGRIIIHSHEIQTPDKKNGTWLNLFCPERSCEILQSTDAPS
jgi:hypothetical protein